MEDITATIRGEYAREDITSTIRGFINDLTRTLTASVVHLDDLLLELTVNSDGYDNAYLADEQLARALEFFLEMRSLVITYCNSQEREDIHIEEIINNAKTILNKLEHKVNNALTVIFGCCDLILLDKISHKTKQKVEIIYNIVERVKSFTASAYDILKPSNYSINNIEQSNKNELTMLHYKKTINNNINILLVEDQDDVRYFVGTVLFNKGYKIIEAATGEDAIKLLDNQAEKINLAFVDVKLPGLSGLDLADRIQSRHKDIRILLTSGYYDERMEKAVNRGFKILKKPFKLHDLYSELDKLCLHY